MAERRTDCDRLAALTVTYHPDLPRLARQIAALPEACWLVVVDNGSTLSELAGLKALVEARPRSHLVLNERNLGLAAAINQAARHAAERIADIDYLLLLDQDSVPGPEAVEGLVAAYRDLRAQDGRVACVGPRLDDVATGLQHGFHRIDGWRWVRLFPSRDDRRPIDVANLNGSGTLVEARFFQQLGGLEEGLFIDHVDTEWAFRVRSQGYKLYGIPWVSFEHGMGEYGLRFWLFGWRVWPQRSPQRHYYLFRNALRLMGRNYVPRVWKGWAAIKLFLTLIVHALLDHRRGEQIRSMLKGTWEGMVRWR